MKCFYHSADLDGHCSGAIVKYFHPGCELFGIDYGDTFPWDDIRRNEKVIMVDFSLQPWKDMQRLDAMTNLVWIDHHKSAIASQKAEPLKTAKVIWGQGNAACELTWAQLFHGNKVPTVVHLLGRYDVWDHSDPNTLPFQYGLRLEDTNPENQVLWRRLFQSEEEIAGILLNGSTVLRYINQEYEKYVRTCAFETELDDLRCIAVNRMLTNSQVFDSVWDADRYDAMLTFGWKNGKWTVSLYSDKDDVDVSQIAKARGGGGHKGAAGFQCQDLPFELT